MLGGSCFAGDPVSHDTHPLFLGVVYITSVIIFTYISSFFGGGGATNTHILDTQRRNIIHHNLLWDFFNLFNQFPTGQMRAMCLLLRSFDLIVC